MSYQVLALKYRPQIFEDVVGQAHVTTTLTNAISSNRVAHALLFTGPRGTGKTTIARILAKAMACTQGPAPAPCNTCKICTDITSGHCADVFEIDGASNNSVDQIRDLRENVAYMPASARVKIYIIDEVHMLSTAAFNALLKTLEEPPDHVIFIFATTEVHKIPATILSRCQRHDLSRISLEQISDHLGVMCEKEGFSLEKESLDLIAMEADGSIRDSLSLLDRVLSASPDKTIDPQTVQENLGVLDRQLISALSQAVFARDGAVLINLVERINDAGQDLKKFYSDIIFHFRNLNIVKLCSPQDPTLNLTSAEKETLGQAVETVSQNYLSLLLQLLLENESLVKHASHTRTAVEMVLLKLIQVNPGMALDQIITRLDTLARQIDTHLSSSEGVRATPGPAMAPDGRPQAPRPDPRQVAEPVPPAYQPGPARDRDMDRYQGPPSPKLAAQAPPPQKSQAQPQNLSWQGFLDKIQDRLPVIYALLSRGQAHMEQDSIRVELEIRSGFEKTRLKTKDKELQALSMTYLGKPINLQISRDTKEPPQDTRENQKAVDKAKQEASMHPLVQETRRMFDGEIIL